MPLHMQVHDPNVLNAQMDNTLCQTLGMQIVACTPTELIMRMPVDGRTKQIVGVLHGGASAALAESVASIAARLTVDTERFNCFGIEINANHLRAVKEGHITATAKALHTGRTTQVWHIELVDDQARLCCVSRLTVAIVSKATNRP